MRVRLPGRKPLRYVFDYAYVMTGSQLRRAYLFAEFDIGSGACSVTHWIGLN